MPRTFREHFEGDPRGTGDRPMFFTFPEDARWNADRQAVEFGVEIGEYHGVVRLPQRVFQRLLPERPTPRPPSGASRRTTYSAPASSASPSANPADASWPRMGMSRSAGGTCARCRGRTSRGGRTQVDHRRRIPLTTIATCYSRNGNRRAARARRGPECRHRAAGRAGGQARLDPLAADFDCRRLSGTPALDDAPR